MLRAEQKYAMIVEHWGCIGMHMPVQRQVKVRFLGETKII